MKATTIKKYITKKDNYELVVFKLDNLTDSNIY